ncbi:S41 family peptidase [Microtetraspora malaysiensis]|uniref:S41 family peptidase n=1 Tax=Microtetraspora malaysiensis TaxID=161358 RepID=UPI003D8C52D8
MSTSAHTYLNQALDIIQKHALESRRVDWPTVRKDALQVASEAKTERDTYVAIQFAINRLGDPHTLFFPPGKWIDAPESDYRDVSVPTGKIEPGGIAFLKLPGVFEGSRKYFDAGSAEIRRLDHSRPCGWIIDLRSNGGGNTWPMWTVLAPLYGDGPLVSFADTKGRKSQVSLRDGRPLLDGKPVGSISNPYRLSRRSTVPIALLVGAVTASAGEDIAVSFNGRNNVRSFGAETAGLLTGNEPFKLSDGAVLNVTTSNTVDTLGRVYGNSPFIPDELVGPKGMNQIDDSVVRAGMSWIKKQPSCHT